MENKNIFLGIAILIFVMWFMHQQKQQTDNRTIEQKILEARQRLISKLSTSQNNPELANIISTLINTGSMILQGLKKNEPADATVIDNYFSKADEYSNIA